MVLTPQNLDHTIRLGFTSLKAEIDLSSLPVEDNRDSLIEKPPQVTKMSYYNSSEKNPKEARQRLF